VDIKSLQTLFAVSLIAALAPIVVAALPRPRIPQVVVLILCGVIIGNQGLGLQNTDSIKLISNVGLGFLFLLAGYELDPQLLRERAGKLAITGWVLSAVIAVGAVAILGAFGYVKDFVPVGLALTTTALGTLLPILHDNDMLAGQFGRARPVERGLGQRLGGQLGQVGHAHRLDRGQAEPGEVLERGRAPLPPAFVGDRVQRDAVDLDRPRRGLVHAEQQLDERGLARAVLPHDRYRRPGRKREVKRGKHGPLRARVLERQVAQRDPRRQPAGRGGGARGRDGGRVMVLEPQQAVGRRAADP